MIRSSALSYRSILNYVYLDLAGSFCCVLGQNILFSQCLSPASNIKGELEGKPDEMPKVVGGRGGGRGRGTL